MSDNSLNDAGLDPGVGTARDLLLNGDNDLALIAGDLVLVRGPPAVTQEVAVRLRYFRGEWFLDILAGVPYVEQVLTKPPNLPRTRTVLSEAIAETPGVARVEEVGAEFFGAERRLSISYRAVLDSGELLNEVVEV